MLSFLQSGIIGGSFSLEFTLLSICFNRSKLILSVTYSEHLLVFLHFLGCSEAVGLTEVLPVDLNVFSTEQICEALLLCAFQAPKDLR